MGERGGKNLYGFVYNNSINLIDILGLTAAAQLDPNDGKHAIGKCSRNQSCKKNVVKLKSELEVLRNRLANDFTYTFMYKAMFGIKHPSPKYETYTESWRGHLIQYTQRLKVAGDCVIIITEQFNEGKCNCKLHFFKSKQWKWSKDEYKRLKKNTPLEIQGIQVPKINPDWDAIGVIGTAGTTIFMFIQSVLGSPLAS